MIGSTRELNVNLYLYNESDAIVVAQRYAFFNSMAQSVVTISGKLNLSLLELNDKIKLNMTRLYKRFGGLDRQKIGMVNKITKTVDGVTIQVNDLSNSFSRVACIADNTSSNFTSASDSEKLVNGYLLDNDTLTPDNTSDIEMYLNLIG